MKRVSVIFITLLHLFLVCQAFSKSAPPPLIEKVSLFRIQDVVSFTPALVTYTKDALVDLDTIKDGTHIVFAIPGIGKYLSEKKNTRQKITLLLNDIDLPELPSYLLFNDSNTLILSFDLGKISSENRKLLYQIPGHPVKSAFVGLSFDSNTRLYFNEPVPIVFEKHKTGKGWGWVFLAVPIAFILMMVLSKGLLRDSLEEMKGLLKEKENTMCYSFSKSQFAFWSLIVLVAYGYIWLVTKDFNTLNETALVLLGISSATIVTGKLIGKSEEERAKDADKEEKSDIDNIKRDQGQTENQQLGRHIQQLIKFRSWKPGEHGGFLKDILSDADGISVHRLQAFAFNVIFAIIFIQQVLTTYSMPDFTATHYILLGLSNGTYAFIKTRENG